MEHDCEQIDCLFNHKGVCTLSYEEAEEPWANFGTIECKEETLWAMEHQSITE